MINFHRFAFNYIKNKLIKFQTERPLEFLELQTKYNINFYNLKDNFIHGSFYTRASDVLDHIALKYDFKKDTHAIEIMLLKNDLNMFSINMEAAGGTWILATEKDRCTRCVFNAHYYNGSLVRYMIVNDLKNDKRHLKYMLKSIFGFTYLKKSGNFHVLGLVKAWKDNIKV